MSTWGRNTTIVIYDTSTGAIKRVVFCHSFLVQNQLQEGESFVEVEDVISAKDYYVVNGIIHPKPPEIIQQELEFIALRNIRRDRDSKLKQEIDTLSSLRLMSMTTGKVQEWQNYREALLSFPETVIDVFNPIWPIPPE